MLDKLFNSAQLWRASDSHTYRPATHDTGISQLNALLPGHGWPTGAITEIIYNAQGIGEIRLLIPLLSQLSKKDKWLLWVCPPHIPYPIALGHHGVDVNKLLIIRELKSNLDLWSIEQALRSNQCSAILAWPKRMTAAHIRRLQMVCSQTNNLCFIFRPLSAQSEHSCAHLRLRISAHQSCADQLLIDILKRRGSWPTTKTISLEIPKIYSNEDGKKD